MKFTASAWFWTELEFDEWGAMEDGNADAARLIDELRAATGKGKRYAIEFSRESLEYLVARFGYHRDRRRYWPAEEGPQAYARVSHRLEAEMSKALA